MEQEIKTIQQSRFILIPKNILVVAVIGIITGELGVILGSGLTFEILTERIVSLDAGYTNWVLVSYLNAANLIGSISILFGRKWGKILL